MKHLSRKPKTASKTTFLLMIFVGLIGPSSWSSTTTAGIMPGDSLQSIDINGVQRTYIIHAPPSYDGATALPLVFVLHGRGQNAKSIEYISGFSDKADAEKFFVVYPNAIGNPTVWNAGINPSIPHPADDVGFLKMLLSKLEQTLKVDHQRIYFCGFSSGAIMSYRMGAELADQLGAVGIASGTVGSHQPNGQSLTIPPPSRPLPVIAFHGKQDQTIYYAGGGALLNTFSVADSIRFWLNADDCNETPQETTAQNGNLIRDGYHHCKQGIDVVLYTFVQGTHEWPKLTNNDHFNSTAAMWEFFVRHPKM